ncbi:MBOAT, membrane-bound O-acyltransferase family-domain-containing protein [Chlamydoabsidia padenii]|nr:MBOAT, membrane-bound O-acyltransferase family-domain-containing protein [Chlamydoabsidia padenii]
MSLSICHLDRQLKGNSGDLTLDYSGMMMIVTIKLTMFGFNVHDGRQQNNRLTPYNQQMKIITFPTLIEFSGWMFFFGGYLVGPACEYMDYLRFTGVNKTQSNVPSPVKPTAMILIKSLFCIGILLSCSTKYNVAIMLKSEWQTNSFAKKLLFIQVTAFVARCKYYTVWLLSEGACVLCGFGFTGYDDQTGKPRWDRVTNIDIVHCELPHSLKEMADHWNMGANRWLKHYVYLRVTRPDKKAGTKSTLITFGVSALWHGFYPGYYIMFLSLGVFTTLSRMIRKSIRPYMDRPVCKSIYDIMGIMATTFIINTMSMAFIALYMSPTWQIWRQVYFIHYILGAATWLTLTLVSGLHVQKTRRVEPKAGDMDVTDLVGVEPPENHIIVCSRIFINSNQLLQVDIRTSYLNCVLSGFRIPTWLTENNLDQQLLNTHKSTFYTKQPYGSTYLTTLVWMYVL